MYGSFLEFPADSRTADRGLHPHCVRKPSRTLCPALSGQSVRQGRHRVSDERRTLCIERLITKCPDTVSAFTFPLFEITRYVRRRGPRNHFCDAELCAQRCPFWP